MGFAENVKSELEFQDIQIKELSALTGISKNTLDKYLSGKKSQPGVENAVKIAHALGVTVEQLVEGKKDSMETSSQSNERFGFTHRYHKLNEFNRRTVEDLIQSLLERQ